MADLNNTGSYSSLDSSGLRHRIRDLPRHCEQAWQRAQSFDFPWTGKPIEQVVIGGMGGQLCMQLCQDFTMTLAPRFDPTCDRVFLPQPEVEGLAAEFELHPQRRQRKYELSSNLRLEHQIYNKIIMFG